MMLRSGGFLMALCLAMALFVGCSDTAPDANRVRVEVANVGVDQQGAPFVLLQDANGGHVLPIMIGESEAQAIELQLHGLNPGRPLTYDLIRNLLAATGNHVDWVEVSDLRDQTYYANISLDHGRTRVDSRPSDAIALALAANAPIYVNAKLFGSAAADVAAHGRGPETAHGLGLTVQEITTEIAPYFSVKPGAALLVADVSDGAQRAGIVRGDLLTQVGTEQVGTLAEFNRRLARLKGRQRVTVTVERDGHHRTVTLIPGKGAN